MTHVLVVLKTNEGGAWILPQVAALQSAGANVTVVIPPGPGRLRLALDRTSVRVVESPFDFGFAPSWRRARDLWRFRRLIRQLEPDAILYHLYASALAVRLTTIAIPVRRIHMVAGPLYLENRWIRTAERILCRLDHNLIAGSEYTRRLYAALGYPQERLSMIPYGVDVARFRPEVDSARDARLGVSASTFVAIMVAFVYAPKSAVFPGVGIKGHDILLDAWRGFAARHPDATLMLVGGGFDAAGEEHRRELRRSLDLDSASVVWFDSVTDVRPYYAAANLSVSPSLSENHGAALEASAMAVPSVVSDAGGLPESVSPETGWVVRAGSREDLSSALEAAFLEHQSGTLARRGLAARRKMIAEFDAELCAQRVAAIVLPEAHRE